MFSFLSHHTRDILEHKTDAIKPRLAKFVSYAYSWPQPDATCRREQFFSLLPSFFFFFFSRNKAQSFRKTRKHGTRLALGDAFVS